MENRARTMWSYWKLCLVALAVANFGQSQQVVRSLVIPSPVTEAFTLDPSTPASQTTLTVTLKSTPVANSTLLYVFRASVADADVVDIVTVAATLPKQLIVTLPTYRPFAGDRLTIVYWTHE